MVCKRLTKHILGIEGLHINIESKLNHTACRYTQYRHLTVDVDLETMYKVSSKQFDKEQKLKMIIEFSPHLNRD